MIGIMGVLLNLLWNVSQRWGIVSCWLAYGLNTLLIGLARIWYLDSGLRGHYTTIDYDSNFQRYLMLSWLSSKVNR